MTRLASGSGPAPQHSPQWHGWPVSGSRPTAFTTVTRLASVRVGSRPTAFNPVARLASVRVPSHSIHHNSTAGQLVSGSHATARWVSRFNTTAHSIHFTLAHCLTSQLLNSNSYHNAFAILEFRAYRNVDHHFYISSTCGKGLVTPCTLLCFSITLDHKQWVGPNCACIRRSAKILKVMVTL